MLISSSFFIVNKLFLCFFYWISLHAFLLQYQIFLWIPYTWLIWRHSTFLLQCLLEFQLVCCLVRRTGHLWLLILTVLVAKFRIGILSFLILHLPHSLVVDLIITWSVLQMSTLITFVFRKSGRSHYHVIM